MKEEELKKKLNFANLILGDVNKTVPNFSTKHKLSPIACIFLDLDFYSSTNSPYIQSPSDFFPLENV